MRGRNFLNRFVPPHKLKMKYYITALDGSSKTVIYPKFKNIKRDSLRLLNRLAKNVPSFQYFLTRESRTKKEIIAKKIINL